MTTSGPSGVRTLFLLREWLPSPLTLGVVAVLGLLGGLSEAAVIALVAAVGATIAQGGEVLSMSLGPLELQLSVGAALLAGVAATLALVISRLIGSYLGTRLAAQTLVETRTRLLDRYLTASYEVQRSWLQAELHELVAVQAMRLAQTALGIAGTLTNALAFVALVCVALLFEPFTAATLLGLSLLLAAVFLPLMRMSHRAGTAHLQAQVQVGVDLGDVTDLLAETHVYGARAGMLERASHSIRRSGRAFGTTALVSQVTPTLYLTAIMTLLLSGLAILTVREVSDLQTLGAILLLTLRGLRYSQMAHTSLQQSIEQAPNIAAASEAGRSFDDAAVTRVGERLVGIQSLELRHVSYRYPDSDEGIEDVSVRMERGEVIGIVGHSGSGKTTFAEVTLGLREATGGLVLVNGRPRQELDGRSWFDHVAYVGQESRLLTGSVASNVAFFRELDEEGVDRALDAASMRDDIDRWDQGVRRDVGHGGRDVSGGQRQRIAIARALAGRPDLVVMDEPTSALDPASEEKVRATIAALAGDVLIILVAHRRSTLEVCDRVLRFHDGRAVEVSPSDLDGLPV